MNGDEIADRILSHLELVLGPRVFDVFIEEITTNYLEGFNVRAAIAQRPELFERALVSTIGISGSAILGEICHKICKDNNKFLTSDSKPVNLAGFIGIMTESNLSEVRDFD